MLVRPIDRLALIRDKVLACNKRLVLHLRYEFIWLRVGNRRRT